MTLARHSSFDYKLTPKNLYYEDPIWFLHDCSNVKLMGGAVPAEVHLHCSITTFQMRHDDDRNGAFYADGKSTLESSKLHFLEVTIIYNAYELFFRWRKIIHPRSW
jgi:hypothetical protein